LQGQEIFRWWSDRLGNQELFDQVADDIDAAASLVRTQRQDKENQEIATLTWLAAFIGTAALVLGFLTLFATAVSWNFLHAGEPESRWNTDVAVNAAEKFSFVLIGMLVATVAITASLIYLLFKAWPKFQQWVKHHRQSPT
jgi:hypothetical protein